MFLLLSVALFALVLAIPAIPMMREIARPRDDGRLYIAEGYVRDPRWFGRAYREKLAPFVAAAHGASYSENLQLRTEEDTRWAPDLAIGAGERLRGIAVGDRVIVGRDAAIRDAYALETLVCESGVVARTLTSDGTLRIDEGVTILRWIDADGAIDVGAGTSLGVSASGTVGVRLATGVQFQRVWGKPVSTHAGASTPFVLSEVPGTRRVGAADIVPNEPLIVFGPLRIAAGTHIPANVKVHGPLEVEPGVHITGTVIVRGDITFAAGVTVEGHVFSESDIRLGPGCRIGREGSTKTLYAARHAVIAGDVEVSGWIVAEDGGETV
jgi:cytoskeletal protein CcmA (bactofilin family)